MTAEEHLDKIVEFCRSRLALAEKRTPGKWWSRVNGVGSSSVFTLTPEGTYHPDAAAVAYGPLNAEHADFIAACAGAAEAGWRATIAAIGAFRRQPAPEGTYHPDNPLFVEDAHAVAAILAAYPLELLEPTTFSPVKP